MSKVNPPPVPFPKSSFLVFPGKVLLSGQSGLLGLEECAALRRAWGRPVCTTTGAYLSGHFPGMRVCTRCAHIKPVSCTTIHTSFLPSKPALSLRLPSGLRRDRCIVENHLGWSGTSILCIFGSPLKRAIGLSFPPINCCSLGVILFSALRWRRKALSRLTTPERGLQEGLGFALVVRFVHDHCLCRPREPQWTCRILTL